MMKCYKGVLMKTLISKFIILIVIFNGAALADSPATIKFGASLYLSGEWAPYGNAFREGIELAEEEFRSSKQGTSDKIQLVIEDNQYQPKIMQKVAKKLIDFDRVQATFAASYHDAKLIAPMFEAAGVPLIVLWDSSPKLEKLGKYIFGIGTWLPSSGHVSAQFASDRFKSKRVAILNSNTEWSLDVSDAFKHKAKELGMEIVRETSFNPDESNFKSILLKVKQDKVDAVYAPIDGNIVAFFKQASELGLGAPIISSDVIGEDYLREAPDAFEGVYQSQSLDPDSKSSKSFYEAYEAKFNKKIAYPLLTAWGYDAYKILADCFRNGARTRAEFTSCLYSIKDFKGASGTITIEKEGSSKVMAAMFQVRNGSLKQVL